MTIAQIAHDAAKILAVIEAFSEQAPDYPGVLDELLLLLHRMTIAQIAPDAVDNGLGDRDRVLELAGKLMAEELQLFYQMGLLGKRDINLAPDLRTGLEMAVLRMLVFRPQGVTEPPGKILNNSPASQQEAPVKKPEAVAPVTATNGATAIANLFEKADHAVPVARQSVGNTESAGEVLSAKPKLPEKPDADVIPEPVLEEEKTSGLTLAQFSCNGDWVNYFSQLPFSGLLKSVLAECVLESVSDEGCWNLVIDTEKAQLYNEKHESQMEEQLSRYFGKPVRVKIRHGNNTLQTPAQFLQARKQAIHAKALSDLKQDDNLQFIMNTWGAEIIEDTVQALNVGEE